MNFDYSYRAFLITCLLFGILFLTFKSITLSKYEIVKEETFDVEYTEEDQPIVEELAAISQLDLKVETNKAFNEAEKFISEIEKENAALQENSFSTQESDQFSDQSNVEENEIRNNKKPLKEENGLSMDNESSNIVSKQNMSKINSTISYSLVNRNALFLPNPVYTCASAGKIVINIVVSEAGKILDTQYNKSSSTTSNECLIDAAMKYAKRAKFTSFAEKTNQLGSITYNFPGQQ